MRSTRLRKSFGARFAGAHFQVDQVELIAQIGMGVPQVFAHAHQGLIERQTDFDADDGEVERVRQAPA